MSIAGIGASSSAHLSQILSRLFTRVDATDQTASSSTPGTSSDSSTRDSGALGSAGAKFSSEILWVLVQLQQQTSAADSSMTSADAASSTSGGTSGATASPLQQLFSAIDADGDGSISKSEFEAYLERNGATQQEADKVFAQLDPQGTGSITQDQLASEIKGHHGHHHHHPSIQDLASRLFSDIDANGDGSISQQEFEDVITQNGGTKAEADQDFAVLDPNGTGSVDATQFVQAFQQLAAAGPSAILAADGASSSSPVLRLFDALASNTANGTSSTTASSTTDPTTTGSTDATHGHRRHHLAERLFSALDTNGNGVVTQSEIEAALSSFGGSTDGASNPLLAFLQARLNA